MGQMAPQNHFMGMNQMHSSGGPPQMGNFPSNFPNVQGGPTNTSVNQMFPHGSFPRPQAGQMPGVNPYQVSKKKTC